MFLFVYRVLTPGDGPTLPRACQGYAAVHGGVRIARAIGETYVANVVARTTALYGAIGAIFGLLAFLYATMWLFLLGCGTLTVLGGAETGPASTERSRWATLPTMSVPM